jgi:glycosyltransferase involved in cell wall biosynthesis
VSPSRWLADCARGSAALGDCDIVVIPNGLDLTRYRPRDRARCRARFGIPHNVPLVAYGAMNSTTDTRKGYSHLASALERLAESNSSLRLLVFGGRDETGATHGVPLHGIGRVDDDATMVELLNAADVFVAPSEQDNLPNTVVEALACGCPVVAFDIGGMPDLVVPGRTGFLAAPFDTAALADCILRALQAGPGLRASAREHAEAHYELGSIARRHMDLYRGLSGR